MKKTSENEIVKPKADGAKQSGTTKNSQKKDESKLDKKQLIVGVIILFVALLLLFFSFYPSQDKVSENITQMKSSFLKEKVDKNRVLPAKIVEQKSENVVFVFTATTDSALNFKLEYTTENNADFDDKHVVLLDGKEGENTYSITVPAEKIARFRLGFGTSVGKVTMRDIYLTGSQTKDLNDLSQYMYYQIMNIDNHGDGSFTFEMLDYNAYMEYRAPL